MGILKHFFEVRYSSHLSYISGEVQNSSVEGEHAGSGWDMAPAAYISFTKAKDLGPRCIDFIFINRNRGLVS
jgi:hypothetical protein